MLRIFETIFKNLIFPTVLCLFPLIASAGSEKAVPKESRELELPKYRKEAEMLKEKIQVSEKRLGSLELQEYTLLTTLDAIDYALDAARKRIDIYRSELAALEREMKNAEALVEKYDKKVYSLAEYAKKRLVAIYKTNRVGLISFAASAESVSDLLFKQNALERIFEHDERIRSELIEEKARLEELLPRLNARRIEKSELEKNLRDEVENMSRERKKREVFLAKVQEEKSSALELLDAYRHAASILDDTLEKLNAQNTSDVSEIYLSEENFESHKGLLNLPVEGTIIDTFGQRANRRRDDQRFCGGISVRADRGEPIRAVKDGRVLFAGWFKGYGNMIIIDHGRHYYTVYAYAQDLFKAKGDLVDSGEVIATVGDSGSISGPRLYFEVRHHGKPVDPMEWIVKG